MEPENDQAAFFKGVTLIHLNKHSEASGFFKKASELDPENIEYIFAYGQSLYDAGDLDNAIIQFQSILDNNRNHLEARQMVVGIMILQD